MKNRTLTFSILFLISTFFYFSGYSQAGRDTLPGYLKQPGIPSFAMRKVPDSSVFTRKDLEEGKATIFMIFGPECGHCETEVKKLEANAELFKDARIVMYTSVKFDITRKFYEKMRLAEYPMFTVGVDPMFNLASFFRFRSLPTLFLYDKQGKFVRKFEGSEMSPELIASEIR